MTTLLIQMAVFWVVAPCSLPEVYRRFRGACYLHHQGDNIFFFRGFTVLEGPWQSHI
jgi:hypothetical protein